MRSLLLLPAALLVALAAPPRAEAWGRAGHETVATIARSYLKDRVREKVDAILASDPDTLTAPDMASRAAWADSWRNTHPQTANWHFANIELGAPDLEAACYGFPSPAAPASAGPADDCVVNRIGAFERELKDPKTAPAEKLLALKYLLHFVGDLHQPLHVSGDHGNQGGNCVRLALGGSRTTNLHSYWDSGVIGTLGEEPPVLARRLEAEITPIELKRWRRGDPKAWAMEGFELARGISYTIASKPGCDREAAPVPLPAGYEGRVRYVIELQLKRAGVRLAEILNRSLG